MEALSHGATITVPAELLSSLLSTVESMKKEMSLINTSLATLEGKNNMLAANSATMEGQIKALSTKLALSEQEFRMLARNSGAAFFFFFKLPPELQLIVWKWALLVPRVVGLGWEEVDEDGWPPGLENQFLRPTALTQPLNTIAGVCKLARTAAMECQTVRLKYDQAFVSRDWDSEKVRVLACHTAADIFWYEGGIDFDPAFGKHALLHFLATLRNMGARSKTFALPLEEWEDMCRSQLIEFLNELVPMGVEEIIVVVGGDRCIKSNDIVFVEPGSDRQPYRVLSSNFLSLRRTDGVFFDWPTLDDPALDLVWAQVEAELLEVVSSAHSLLKSYDVPPDGSISVARSVLKGK